VTQIAVALDKQVQSFLWGGKDSNLRPTDYESRRQPSIEANLARANHVQGVRLSSVESGTNFGTKFFPADPDHLDQVARA
jgi:hypothetical protein